MQKQVYGKDFHFRIVSLTFIWGGGDLHTHVWNWNQLESFIYSFIHYSFRLLFVFGMIENGNLILKKNYRCEAWVLRLEQGRAETFQTVTYVV